MKNLSLCAALLLAFSFNTFAQIVDLAPIVLKPTESSINGKKVSFTRFLLEMEKAEGWMVFRDIKVRFSYDEDKGFGMDEWFVKKNKALHFKARHIGIYNCDFDEEYWLVLHGAIFDGDLSFVGCTKVKAVFENCTFKEAVRLHGNEFEFANFSDCRFELGFRFTRGQVADNLTFKRCVFDYNTALIGSGDGFDMDDRLFYISNKIDGLDIIIDSCTFKKNAALQTIKSFVDLSESQFKNVIIQHSTFETGLDLERTLVNGYLDLSDNLFSGGILPNGLTYNFNNSTILWSDLKNNNISIYDKTRDVVLHKNNVNEPYDANNFNKIISAYTAIFNGYKSQGNMADANKCYYQRKEIETEGLGKRKEFTHYILDRFLAIFCDYGTNPIKAAKYSVLIIFLFALAYLFIPFHETSAAPSSHKRRQDLIQKIRKSNGNYAMLYKRETAVFSTTHKQNRNRHGTRLKAQVFTKVEHLGKSKINKHFKGKPLRLAFALMNAGNNIQHYSSKLLHSLVLSMNAFVTLGFGSMKVKGDYIYLSIIEGVMGWFLLSIFTVSLINQIINW
jgi:uncharacterized protein YjbI with pentapeptide repeats